MQNALQPEELPEENPLEFWTAYLPGEGENKHYLSDGKGHLRIFKTQAAANTYLDENLNIEVREKVIVHSVQGQIALPEETQNLPPENEAVIQTLAGEVMPSVTELLADQLRRRKRTRSRK